MSAADWPRIAVVFEPDTRGDDWRVEVSSGGTIRPRDVAAFETVLDEAAAAASLLNDSPPNPALAERIKAR